MNLNKINNEKIETILRRGKYNARMKDEHDVYFFLHNMKDEINNADFRSALNNTLIKRESLEYYKNYEIILKEIITYDICHENGKKNYVGGSTFLELYEAFMKGKEIYLWNEIPEGILFDEISGFSPKIINGNLDLVK